MRTEYQKGQINNKSHIKDEQTFIHWRRRPIFSELYYSQFQGRLDKAMYNESKVLDSSKLGIIEKYLYRGITN